MPLPAKYLVLDVSRLLSQQARKTPTGIERVELAYAEALIERFGHRARFSRRAFGRIVAAPSAPFQRLVRAKLHLWQGTVSEKPTASTPALIDRARVSRAACISLSAGRKSIFSDVRTNTPLIYLLVSHANLHLPAAITHLKRSADVRLVCLLHDLIPYTHPEYARPREPKRHRVRLRTLAREADLVITNSQATADEFHEFCESEGRWPRIEAIPLAVDTRLIDAASPVKPAMPWDAQPYFVVIGTIEPRKNHLLLLNIWHRLAQELGSKAPHLLVIGRRGWENENIIDVLDRRPSMPGKVHELNDLNDAELWTLLRNARALLFPSFVEGYGLPLIESLAVGTPVICSDIAVFREIGCDIPCFLDPLDGVGWLNVIMRFCDDKDPIRSEYIARGRDWQTPTWEDYFARVWKLLEKL